jgi:hypothetical protein
VRGPGFRDERNRSESIGLFSRKRTADLYGDKIWGGQISAAEVDRAMRGVGKLPSRGRVMRGAVPMRGRIVPGRGTDRPGTEHQRTQSETEGDDGAEYRTHERLEHPGPGHGKSKVTRAGNPCNLYSRPRFGYGDEEQRVEGRVGNALLLRETTVDSLPIMKSLFAALLLLSQLQPLVGSAVCLSYSVNTAKQECEMPDHMAMPSHGVAEHQSPLPNCALSAVCAPSQLAIAGLPESSQSVMHLRAEPSMISTTTLFSIASAPPFHPPRA